MIMIIKVLCSDKAHPVYSYLEKWKSRQVDHEIMLINRLADVGAGGDILFLVSCTELVTEEMRKKFRYTLVLHASDLPHGRGWSPHIWDIVNGRKEITLSLLNAEDKIDSGDIWKKIKIPLTGYELYDEINEKLFQAELGMLDWACENIEWAVPVPQAQSGSSYNRKRTPVDSTLDIDKSLRSQFNLVRVCDPERYPALINIDGHKFKLILIRDENE